MERIEYASRMEDYIALQKLYRHHLHLKLGASARTRKTVVYWLILNGGLLVWLRYSGNDWPNAISWELNLILFQLLIFVFFIMFTRKQAIQEIRRHFQEGHLKEERRILQYDDERIQFDCTEFRMEISWRIIWAMAIMPDWVVMFYGVNNCLFLRRQSVTAGDFNRFIITASTRFREVQQQQGIEPKIIRVDPNSKPYREPSIFVWKTLFGILWGVGFFLAAGVILISLYLGFYYVLRAMSVLQDKEAQGIIAAIFGWSLVVGTLLSGTVGVILGVAGVLPGARKKNQTSKIKE